MDRDDHFIAEVVWFVPAQKYLKRHPRDELAVSGPPLGEQYQEDGFLGIHHGYNRDQDHSAVTISAWQSFKHFQDFAETEAYGNLVILHMDIMHTPTSIMEVCFDDMPAFFHSVRSPVTEFVYITVRRGHDIDYQLRPLINFLREELKAIPSYIASTWGSPLEGSNIFVGMIGWKDDHGSIHLPQLARPLAEILEFSCIERKVSKLKMATITSDDDSS